MTATLKPLAIASTASANAALALGKHTPVDCSSAARTMTLPTGAAEGRVIQVSKVDAGSNALNVTGNIRGSAGATLSTSSQYDGWILTADSAGSWWPGPHKTKSQLDGLYASKTTYDAFVDSVGDEFDTKEDVDLNIVRSDAPGKRLLTDPDAEPGPDDIVVFPGRPAQIIAQNLGSGSGVTNTTTETDIDNLTIDHTLVAAHDVLDYQAEGWLQNQTGSTSGTIYLRVYLGTTLLAQGAQTIATGATNLTRWEVSLKIHLASLTDQRVNGSLRYITEAIGAAAASVAYKASYGVVREAGQIAENLASDKALRVTVQFSAATANLAAKRDASYVERKPGI